MTQSTSIAVETAAHAHLSPLPALLRDRFHRLGGRNMSALLQASSAPDSTAVRLFSNDYLSLSNDPRIMGEVLLGAASSGDAPWMSSVFFREDSPQRTLERRFAAYLGTEDATITQSGYCANLGLMQAIAGPGTKVFIDACAHASLWHGVLASRATPRRFAHNDPACLEALLQTEGPGLVVVDSIYSHDGSVCPLREVVDLATRHDCVMIVDESHALGAYGPEGAGLVAALGLAPQVHFLTSSLAKAFVTRAGLVAASQAACDGLRYSAGPAIFSSACMPHDLAGLARALDVIAGADDRRRRLHQNAGHLRNRLATLGYAVSSRSQIIALESGTEAETLRLRQFLDSKGVYGSVFCAPATRQNESLVRLSIHASLSSADCDRVVNACSEARNHVQFDAWASTVRAAADSDAPITERSR
jgi:CAI-1 autoinducer synthase